MYFVTLEGANVFSAHFSLALLVILKDSISDDGSSLVSCINLYSLNPDSLCGQIGYCISVL